MDTRIAKLKTTKIQPRLEKAIKEIYHQVNTDAFNDPDDLIDELLEITGRSKEEGIHVKINSDLLFTLCEAYYNDVKGDEDMLTEFIGTSFEFYDFMNTKHQQWVEEKALELMMKYPESNIESMAIEFFREKFQQKDPDFKKLVELSTQYSLASKNRNEAFFKAREALLKQEFKISLQEISEPDKYMLRAKVMGAVDGESKNKVDEQAKIVLTGLRALIPTLSVSSELKVDCFDLPPRKLADKAFELFNHYNKNPDNCSQELANKIKLETHTLLDIVFDLLPIDYQQKVASLSKEILRNEKNEELMNSAFFTLLMIKDKTKNNDTTKDLNRLLIETWKQNNGNIKKQRTTLKLLARMNSNDSKKLIKDIMNDETAPFTLKKTAVWAMGRIQTQAHYAYLCDILSPDLSTNIRRLNTEELELKEIALHSLSEYKFKQALSKVQKLADSHSELSQLASLLVQKHKLKFRQEPEYMLKQEIHELSERDKFKKLRNQYMPGFNKLSTKSKNWTDRALIPFIPVLKECIKNKQTVTVHDGLISAILNDTAGTRTNYGMFRDTAGGIAGSEGNIVIPLNQYSTPDDSDFTFAHEWAHQVNYHFEEKYPHLQQELEALYDNAKASHKCLDGYAESSVYEYFAQGYAAFVSDYIPHGYVDNGEEYESNLAHTKSELKRKDPQLHDFIEKVIDFYQKVNTQSPLNLVA